MCGHEPRPGGADGGTGTGSPRVPVAGYHAGMEARPPGVPATGSPYAGLEPEAAPSRQGRWRRRARKLFRDVVIPITVAFGVAMCAQATLAKPYKIPSGSMLPTIRLNDRIIADRVIYHFRDIQRGDVIVFRPPTEHTGAEPGIPFVKRVIGLPGDTVEITGGKVLVNGEEFVIEGADSPRYTRPPQVVPEGQLFVLGDNRNESSDSHIWGYVPIENVIGRVDFIYWPPRHMDTL